MKPYNGQRLNVVRALRGVTVWRMAEYSGVKMGTVRDWIYNKSEPPQETLESLAVWLKMPVEFFYGDDIEVPGRYEITV